MFPFPESNESVYGWDMGLNGIKAADLDSRFSVWWLFLDVGKTILEGVGGWMERVKRAKEHPHSGNK